MDTALTVQAEPSAGHSTAGSSGIFRWGAEPGFSTTTTAQSNPLAGYKTKEVPWGKWVICGVLPGKKLQFVLDNDEYTEGSSQNPLVWEFLLGACQSQWELVQVGRFLYPLLGWAGHLCSPMVPVVPQNVVAACGCPGHTGMGSGGHRLPHLPSQPALSCVLAWSAPRTPLCPSRRAGHDLASGTACLSPARGQATVPPHL